jgi:uncharacterized protein
MAKTKSADPAADPVLRRFRAALDQIYGDRIERVVLFGSRARGESHAESDYDVAVFLKELTDRPAEVRRLTDLSIALLDETGEDVQAIPFAAGAYRNRTPLMHEIRLDAIDLGPAGPPLSVYSPPPAEKPSDTSKMSPEAAFFMEKAGESLKRARGNLTMNFAEEAGRLAYMGALNAAQALIFERSGRVVKTHRGVRARFGLLTKDETSIDAGLRRFLQEGFELKRKADYFEIGDVAVSPEEAQEAIETATRFVAAVAALLT